MKLRKRAGLTEGENLDQNPPPVPPRRLNPFSIEIKEDNPADREDQYIVPVGVANIASF